MIKTITVGIPTINRQYVLIKTIESLLKNMTKEVIEIIIVDQTADKQLVQKNKETIFTMSPLVKYITSDIPSVCKARNIIIENAKGDIVYFIDDDVLLTSNTIKSHLSLYDKGVSSVIGKIYNRKDNEDYENLDISEPTRGTIDLFPDTNEITLDFKGFGVSCNQSYTKQSLLEVRGFDENFQGGYYEDADIINRIRKNGHKVGFHPDAMVLHLRAPSGGLRFDKVQPIKLEIKYYSFIFYYVRNFNLSFNQFSKLWLVLRTGPFLKKNFINPLVFFKFLLITPKLFIKAYKDRKKVKSFQNQTLG